MEGTATLTTTTPYSDGWLAAHSGKVRAVPVLIFPTGIDSEQWFRGYDDAKAGKIDAKAFLGPEFVETKI